MIRFTVMTAAYVDSDNAQVLFRDVSRMDRVEAIVEQFRQLPPADPPSRRAPRRKWWWVLAAVPILIVVVVAVRRGDAAPTEVAPVPHATNWRVVVQHIDDIRMQAFMRRDPELLQQVLVVGSPAYAHDLKVLQQLEVRGLVLDRNPVALVSVRELSASTRDGVEQARLHVVDRLGAHTFMAESSTVVRSGGREARMWFLDMQRRRGRPWRLYAVTAAVSKPSTQVSGQGR